jgi:hypothetical protein
MSRGTQQAVIAAVLLHGMLAGMLAGTAGAAEPATGERPLLVVVETGPGAGCDGAAVRGAIEAELKARVAAPAAPPVVALSAPRSDILLVSVDRGRIVVTLRGRGDRELTRSIAAPTDRVERLRAVAWLAGNVARDQLATLTLPAAPAEPAAPPAAAESTPEPAPAPEAPAAAPATQPPPATAPAASSAPPAAGVSTIAREAPQLSRAAPPRWTLGVDTGLGAVFHGPFNNTSYDNRYGAMMQVELQRHLSAPFLVGAALDVGPNLSRRWGLALVAGVERRSTDLFLSVTAGAGVEAFRQTWLVSDDRVAGVAVAREEQELDAMPYVRSAIEFGLALTRAVDLMARLNGHLALTVDNNPYAAYAGASLGVRMRIY